MRRTRSNIGLASIVGVLALPLAGCPDPCSDGDCACVGVPEVAITDDVPTMIPGEFPRGRGELEGSCGGLDESEAVFSWTPPETGTYRFSVTADSDVVFYVLSGDDATCGEEIGCADDSYGDEELIMRVEGGEPLLIVVDQWTDANGDSFVVSVEP